MTDTRSHTTSLSERLDALPFTRKHLKVLTGSGLGWALDAMDVGLISFVIAALAVQWNLEPGQTAWIASIGFVGMAIGATLGGLLADRFGRRQVFALTLLVYGLATGASALVVRWGLPESARWLERRGRTEEADAVVRSFEQAADAPSTAADAQGDEAP